MTRDANSPKKRRPDGRRMLFLRNHPQEYGHVLPQDELFGQSRKLPPAPLKKAGAALYMGTKSVEPQSGHGIRDSVLSSIEASVLNSN